MKLVLLPFCAALLALPAAAQFVEVTARLEITNWQYQAETGLPLKSTRTASVRCVVSTNEWLVEHQPRTNTTDSTWFMNRKLIRQINYNDEPASEDATFRSFRRYSRPASVFDNSDGYPAGELIVNVPWFAFCSGPFLRRSTRGVPVPVSAPDRAAFGFTNETSIFADSLGLPRRAVFHAPTGQIKCDFQVQQSTNLFGWNFPLAFTVVQNEPDSFGKWNRQLMIAGLVTSIRRTQPIALPEDLQERLDYREQFPVRRR
jgi:hypothetical protein